jgi:hypothetical protein
MGVLFSTGDVISNNELPYCETTKKDKKRCGNEETPHTRVLEFINDNNDNSIWGKSLVEKLQKKHEASGRRNNLKGHTGRRCPYAATHGCDTGLEGATQIF